MVRKSQLLCGMATIGDIFRFFGRFAFMSSHCMMVAYPCATFSCASAQILAAASGLVAEAWGPRKIAASMCSLVQAGPQSMGHPAVA